MTQQSETAPTNYWQMSGSSRRPVNQTLGQSTVNLMADAEILLETIWQLMTDAATPPGNGLTLMNIATIGRNGGPRARSVILRDFARSPERLGFATHASSAKVAEIRSNSAVAATCYDRKRSLQLRFEGTAEIIADDAERWRAWQLLAPHSRQQYVSLATPGRELTTHDPCEDDVSTAFQRFAWISVQLRHLEWLDLSTDPHTRWQFELINNGWSGQRVIP